MNYQLYPKMQIGLLLLYPHPLPSALYPRLPLNPRRRGKRRKRNRKQDLENTVSHQSSHHNTTQISPAQKKPTPLNPQQPTQPPHLIAAKTLCTHCSDMPGGSMMKDGGTSTIVGGFGGRTSGVEIGSGGSTAIGGMSPVEEVEGSIK